MEGGFIFDIQGFSVHDGPGCRTVVFLKGCSLACKWCSNPEGITSYPVPLYNSEKCNHSGSCIEACKKKDAISVQKEDEDNSISKNSSFNLLTPTLSTSREGEKEVFRDKYNGRLVIKRELCSECYDYDCVKACSTGALKSAGYYITTEDLIKIIQRDRDYWGEDGGITLTGGEPLRQPLFATDILKKCFESYIHTAIETCGNVEWKKFADIIDYTEWIFYDIKHTDSTKHKEWTGADNKLILENVQRLTKHFTGRIIIRTPLVPGFNDTLQEMEDIADFMQNAGLKEINILPLHHLGKEKYNLLGQAYFDEKLTKPSKENIDNIVSMFESKGLSCYEGYRTPF